MKNSKLFGRRLTVLIAIFLLLSNFVIAINGTDIIDVKNNNQKNPLGPIDENWWNTDFIYRKLITINFILVDGTLRNFPILVHIDFDTNLSSHAQEDGDDICFISYEDNSTKFNHEIEYYSSGNLWAWVNLDII